MFCIRKVVSSGGKSKIGKIESAAGGIYKD